MESQTVEQSYFPQKETEQFNSTTVRADSMLKRQTDVTNDQILMAMRNQKITQARNVILPFGSLGAFGIEMLTNNPLVYIPIAVGFSLAATLGIPAFFKLRDKFRAKRLQKQETKPSIQPKLAPKLAAV